MQTKQNQKQKIEAKRGCYTVKINHGHPLIEFCKEDSIYAVQQNIVIRDTHDLEDLWVAIGSALDQANNEQ